MILPPLVFPDLVFKDALISSYYQKWYSIWQSKICKFNLRKLELSTREPRLIKLVPLLSFAYNFIWLTLFNCNAHVLYKIIFSSKPGFILETRLFLNYVFLKMCVIHILKCSTDLDIYISFQILLLYSSSRGVFPSDLHSYTKRRFISPFAPPFSPWLSLRIYGREVGWECCIPPVLIWGLSLGCWSGVESNNFF